MSHANNEKNSDLLIMALLNRKLIEDLNVVLMLISSLKHECFNFDKYEAIKKILLKLFETDSIHHDDFELMVYISKLA
jgi:hypothetical protein